MELWDLYDRDRKPLGTTHVRGEKLGEGEFHIVVNILSVNKDGKILITKRHPDKPFGGKWEISGGSAVAGESSPEAAVRELFEETGLKAGGELLYYGTIIRQPSGCIHDFYLYRGDFSEEDIVLQEGETVDFKLLSADEIYEMAEKGEFLDFLYNRIKGVFSDIFGAGL
ncbi:MAG: NUDIX domain-containing protein [Oscillospiraceae bacterium]